jgi:AcrR family transcriptional regulator
MTKSKEAAKRGPGLRERKKEEVRALILTTAAGLFRKKGYVATSMTDIADCANIARKTLFNYMETKESVLLAIIDDFILTNLPDWIEPELPVHGDVRDVIAPGLAQRLDVLAKNRWMLELAAQHTRLFSGSTTASIGNAHRVNRHARERRIAKLQAAGQIRHDISAAEISAYYDALRDLTLRNWLLKPRSSVRELHESFVRVTGVLLQGLMPPGKIANNSALMIF